jgi:hypothetical protein
MFLSVDSRRFYTDHTGHYATGLNSVLLHRGHLPAASNVTGLVKCFTYRHSLHFHRVECCSCGRSTWLNAFAAIPRIASRAALSVLSVESISSAPSAEVCRLICAIFAPRDAANRFSCSDEHIDQLSACRDKCPRATSGTMKRNLDTIRKVLELAEAQPAGEPLMAFSGDFENTPVEIIEHIKLMIDAGLIEGEADPHPEMATGGMFVISNLSARSSQRRGETSHRTLIWPRISQSRKRVSLFSACLRRHL